MGFSVWLLSANFDNLNDAGNSGNFLELHTWINFTSGQRNLIKTFHNEAKWLQKMHWNLSCCLYSCQLEKSLFHSKSIFYVQNHLNLSFKSIISETNLYYLHFLVTLILDIPLRRPKVQILLILATFYFQI